MNEYPYPEPSFFSYAADVIIIILLFTIFGYIHSVLASVKFKNKIKERVRERIAFYRLFYNISQLALFLLLFDLMPKPDLVIYDLPYPYDFIVLIPQFAAIAGFIWCFRYFSFWEFAGISQIIRWQKGEHSINELDEKMTLVIAGPYKFVRHPLYFFTIIFLLFRPMMNLFDFVFLLCAAAYFYTGSVYEERKLVEVFGDEYIAYRKKVSSIIPFLK